jgi:NDP-sugar pyrophosphorylase family protein
MSWTGLIMAGGEGRRMVESGIAEPKPLVKVMGRTLLERNCAILLAAGCSNLAVSVSRRNEKVTEAARRLAPQAAARGSRFELIMEDRPLGNFGAAALLADRGGAVLLVYADNLTTLDLRAVMAAHLDSGAALTLAVHLQPFKMPYGEIAPDPWAPDEMLCYKEKPTYQILISSGIAAVAPAALDLMLPDTPLGLSDFAGLVRSSGRKALLHRHEAHWIDVNDAAAIAAAERMLFEAPGMFGEQLA